MIADLLIVLQWHRGADAAISADDLLATMRSRGHDLQHMKDLRDLIHEARIERHLICSCGRGYFLPTTLNEAIAAIDERFRVPARDQLHTARILRQVAHEEFDGQLRLME